MFHLYWCRSIIFISFCHRCQQPFLVDEWKQVYAHPSESSSIDIKAEIGWVEINDFTRRLVSEMPVAFWNGVGTLLGKDGHQLLEGPQRRSYGEIDPHLVTLDKVRRKRCIVERIVPIPALTALIVV